MSSRLHKVMVSRHDTESANLFSYILGFTLSIILTGWAYLATTHHVFGGWGLVATLFLLATVQFVVQVVYFLHLGQEARPRWKRLLLIMMITFVLILVLGSIWIMYNLNYRMTQDQIHHYLQTQDGGI